jgi:hypothetical protein
MVEKGARALGIAWGMNMGLGTLRMNGFTEGIKRLKKLMEEEVGMSGTNQHPSVACCTGFDPHGNGQTQATIPNITLIDFQRML